LPDLPYLPAYDPVTIINLTSSPTGCVMRPVKPVVLIVVVVIFVVHSHSG